MPVKVSILMFTIVWLTHRALVPVCKNRSRKSCMRMHGWNFAVNWQQDQL